MKLTNDTVVERVETFCYLGDMLISDGGCDRAVITRISKAWNKLLELKPVLCAKEISLKVRGRVYVTCVTSCIVYGGKTWAASAETERRPERIAWFMYGVRLRNKCANSDLRNRLGIDSIVEAV